MENYWHITNLFLMYNLRRQLYNVAIESEATAQMNLQISTDKYKAGAINSFNYRDVQLIYLNAAINKLTAIYNLTSSHIDLLKVTGGLISKFE